MYNKSDEELIRLKILALSGSLRLNSYNTAALEALKLLAPAGIEINIGGIKNLPLFNPDLDEAHIPALEELKSKVAEASGVVIASPEYAHGISGPMKNALDWLVSGEEFPNKPIMLINTSPRASHALDALKEVLVTMSGVIIDSACVTVPLLGSDLDKESIVANTEISRILTDGLVEFCAQIKTQIYAAEG
jgi:chromate reductase, NAD(P)H dehydrogenase (quinone)